MSCVQQAVVNTAESHLWGTRYDGLCAVLYKFFILCCECLSVFVFWLLWRGFHQFKHCFVWIVRIESLVFNGECILWIFILMFTLLFLLVHRSVLCNDDPPWCHSSRHTAHHRPTNTALPCVSISVWKKQIELILQHETQPFLLNPWTDLLKHSCYSLKTPI